MVKSRTRKPSKAKKPAKLMVKSRVKAGLFLDK